MARRRRGRRSFGGRGRRRGRGRGKGGILFGLRVMDIGQGVYNASALGYIDAAKYLANGQTDSAATAITAPLTNVRKMIGIGVDNIIIGVNRKILRAFGGKFVRRYFA